MEVMNIKELSQYMKISTSTIRRLIRRNEVPFYKVSSQYFFNKECINEWVKRQIENNYSEVNK